MADEKKGQTGTQEEESTESRPLDAADLEKVVGGSSDVAPGDQGEPGAGLPWAPNHRGQGPKGAGE